MKRATARVGLALGGAALLVIAAALAREGQLPESFSEWDDKLVWEEVHELAQLSNMTNKDPPLIARWFDCHGYTGALVVRDLPEVASRYFVHVGHLPGEEHRRVHHIAIRGTVSLADLSIDLKIRQVFDEECGCLFHAGFKEVADKVADDVVQFLEDGAEVKVAGHSLGGAVAIIVAAKLRLRGYDIGKVMTFGAPMVTDTAGAALLRDFIPVMRVTHERDPIPLTPLGRFKVSVVGGQRVQETEVDLEANPSQAEAWLDSAAMDGVRAEPEGTTGPSSVLKEGEGERGGGGDIGEDSSGVSGEGEGNGRRAGEKGADDAERWRVGSSSAYSHFGSHVVLLRRRKCIECYREETTASPPKPARLRRRLTTAVGAWDDVWGPAPGLTSSVTANPSSADDECEHCPSRGTTYYDPKGEDGSIFDSPWLRLSHVNYTHRMNRYEDEVASRLEHQLVRDDPGDDRLSSPGSDDEVRNALQPPLAGVAGMTPSVNSVGMDGKAVTVR
eukprot:jgi/Undpi1/7928/HiC_scaffold_24.g10400.m1